MARTGYTTQALASPRLCSDRGEIPFIDVGMVAGYSLFKEGMYVAMDEYWYSRKKQIDGLNLGKMRHSFHSVVLFDHIFQISCIWGNLLSTV